MKQKNKDKFNFEVKMLLSIFFITALFAAADLIGGINRAIPYSSFIPSFSINPAAKNIGNLKKFSSEQDFKNYLDAASKLDSGYGASFGRQLSMEALPMTPSAISKNAADGMGAGAPERISETNVQVIGIDEPDIVKTDGKEIYFSGAQRFYPLTRDNIGMGISFEEQKMIAPYPYPTPQEETKIIKAFPPADLALDGKIDKQGDLLLDKNNLIVFSSNTNYYGYNDYSGYGSNREVNGYDVFNPKSPAKKWTIKLDNNTSVVASRLHDGKIYLITKNNINMPRPCPLKPLSVDGVELNIKCAEIYHPVAPIPVDSTFTSMILNPATGKIENTVSFIGSSGASTIYVSENAIYATYAYNESIAKFFSGFVEENSDLFPSWLSEKAVKLEKYDISEYSKIQEIMTLIEQYNNSLNGDERLKVENETTNRMSAYYKKHSRELEKTGIVKIDLDKFQIAASGAVPGHLLNNFAMDEYQGNLRVASTIGSRGGIFSGIGTSESVSDITILDKNLKEIGSVRDLGKTEQIYSVRFVEDKGYVVTFRQTDPFYIVDLTNSANPKMTGELKIPGFSSYLHPLDKTHILGIGMEGSKVKISLFDVSDKNNPVELDKYLLDEYWSEVSNNYHAFLLDTKHSIFFLPGSKGGYVFSYENYYRPRAKTIPPECYPYEIKLKKAISQNSVKRAIYLNDYLYIIGENKITVLNELDWEKVNELGLR